MENSINQLDQISITKYIWKSRYADAAEGKYGADRAKSLIIRSNRSVPVEDRGLEDLKLKKLVTSLPLAYSFMEPLFAGVTPDGYACLIFPYFDSKPLEYTELSYEEGLGLFIQCLKSLDSFSFNGYVFHDICLDVFRLVRSQEVMFLGFLSNLISPSGTTVLPNDANRIFYSPEEIIGGEIAEQSMIFSLGVLGYLLVAREEKKNLNPTGVNNFLKENPAPSTCGNGVPEWLDVVLGHCLKVSPEQRIASIADLLNALEEGIRTDKSTLGSVKWSSRDVVSKGESELIVQSSTKSTSPVAGKKIPDPIKDDVRARPVKKAKFKLELPKMLIYCVWFTTACLGIGLSVFVFSSLKFISFSSNLNSKTLEEIRALDSGRKLDRELRILDDVKESSKSRFDAMNKILGTNVEIDKLFIKYCQEAQLTEEFRDSIKLKFFDHIKAFGYETTRTYLLKYFEKNSANFCEVGETYFDLLNPLNADADRIKSLRAIATKSLDEGILLAGYLSTESTESLFLDELRRFLTGKGFIHIPDSFNLTLLSILQPSLQDVIGKTSEDTIASLSDGDLKNILMVILRSDDLTSEALPKLLEKYRASSNLGSRNVKLLEIAHTMKESNIRISHMIILSALQLLGAEDVNAFINWADSRFEEVLCLSIGVGQAENVTIPLLEVLTTRGISNLRVKILLDWLKEGFWSNRAKYAPSLITVATKEFASNEELEKAFADLMPISHNNLFDAFVKIDEPYYILQAISRMGEIVDSNVLIPFLKNQNKEVRIATVQALSGRNDLQTLQSILRAFRWEKDPDVIEVYKKNHWVTLDRDVPQNLKNRG